MSPKTSTNKSTGTSTPKTAAKDKGTKEAVWAQAQLEALQAQRSSGPGWLEEPHLWQEGQLEQLLDRINAGSLKEVPQEVREGVEFYISQYAAGQETEEDAFYIDRELYSDVLAPVPEDEPSAPYVRATSLPEEVAAAGKLQEWTEIKPQGMSLLKKVLVNHKESAMVQETGVARLGVLLAAARDNGSGEVADGLAPAVLAPIVINAMKRFPQDARVQRVCCSVLRGIVVVDGGCTVVADAGGPALAIKAIKAHLLNMEVCKSGAAVIYAMIQKTEPSSLERISMRSIDAHQVLAQALQTHPTDRALDRACRVAMPELKE